MEDSLNKQKLELMKVAELKTIAESKNIEHDKNATKPELIKAITKKMTEKKQEKNKTEEKRIEPLKNRIGIVDLTDRHGFIRVNKWNQSSEDVFIPQLIKNKFKLKTGDIVEAKITPPRRAKKEKHSAAIDIVSINGTKSPYQYIKQRKTFEKLTPIYPNERIRLETTPLKTTARIIDIIAPIGLGQRALIVSPPKAGKTTILKDIADSISQNHPNVKLFALLIDERPEEVTDFERSIDGEVISSTFDERPENHTHVAELVIEHAKSLAEQDKDVVILLDSITRLARAYNLTVNSSGRTLSGGLDPASLYKPKRFFGSARNIENGGSLTIIATALVDTGSKLDDIIYEEFKGTGNLEVHLDRGLANRRLYPAVDINKSSTRHEELLYQDEELRKIWKLRRMLSSLDPVESLEVMLNGINSHKTNIEFLEGEELNRNSGNITF